MSLDNGCPIPLDQLTGAARKAADPASPVPARLMAARGLAPMAPKELVTAQYVLTFDADAKVQEAATSSLVNLDARLANAVLSDTSLNPYVLEYLARALATKDALIEKLLLNPATPSTAFVAVAETASEHTTEIIANNQQRLLSEPDIAKALTKNPKALKSTIDRVIDFLVRNGIILDGVGEFEQAILRLNGDERLAAVANVEVPKELLADEYLSEEDREEVRERRLITDEDAGEEGEGEEKKQTFEQLLRTMTTGQKVALATKGNKAVRFRMLRDTNRVVALAAATAPSVSEPEMIEMAASRTVNQDVIAYISKKKDLLKIYLVKVALCNNPKCPLPVAMKLLPTLQKKEMRGVAQSKNVPAALRNMAINILKASQK